MAENVTTKLLALVGTAGSQKAAADKLGITPGYLSDLLRGNRKPGEKLLVKLGLRRTITYENVSDSQEEK